MTNQNESNPFPPSEADPLSATGMFLRAFDTAAEPTTEPAKAPFDFGDPKPYAAPVRPPEPVAVQPPPASKPGGPGEFTQLFQAMEPRATPPPAPSAPIQSAPFQPAPVASSPIQSHPVQSVPIPAAPPQSPKFESQAAPAPGEFTRIFVSGSVSPASAIPPSASPEYSARTVLEPPPASSYAAPPAPAPAKMKGFSSPGVSDSASAEGSFTQFFKAAPAPSPQVQSFAPPAPPPPVQEEPWSREPEFGTRPDSRPAPSYSDSAEPGSATGMLSSISSGSSSAAAPRPPAPEPWQPAPAPYQAASRPDSQSVALPSYNPAPPPVAPSPSEGAGVTRLIQRLSQVTPPQAPPEAYAVPAPIAPIPAATTPSSGPGEFTRMISGEALRAATGAAAPPAPAAATPPAPAFSIPPPVIPKPAIPQPVIAQPVVPQQAFQAPAAPVPQAPALPPLTFAAPPVAAPKPVALAAAPAKPDSMVRILLIVNLFLTVIVLVVVLFAMKAK